MNRIFVFMLALAAMLAPAATSAQLVKIDPSANSGTWIYAHGLAFGPKDGTATLVDATHPLPVTSSGGVPVTVVGSTIIASANFTTPAGTSAYALNNLIANSATAGSVVPMTFTSACRVNGGTGMIRRLRIKTPDTGFAGQTVTEYFYRDSPTVTNGDHAAWLSTESNYIGAVTVTLDKHFSDYEKGVGTPSVGTEINFDCATGSTAIYGLLVAGGAITPQGAKVITAVAEILAN